MQSCIPAMIWWWCGGSVTSYPDEVLGSTPQTWLNGLALSHVSRLTLSGAPKILLYCMEYNRPTTVTGVVIARTPPYAQLPTDAPTRARNYFWFTSYTFLKWPVLIKYWLLHPFFYEEATSKSSTKEGLLYAPEESGQEYFKCLSLDTLRRDIMSTSLKNPEEHKKGMLSDQPRLTHVTSMVLLCCWGWQLLKDMMSLRTDFETHAIWQGYIEEPAAKDFVTRKVCTITLSKPQGTHWNVIKCKLHLGIVQMLS
jgi:hypothetical protein